MEGTTKGQTELGNGYSCRAEGGLLLPLLFAGRQSVGHRYELGEILNWKQLYYEGN